MALDRLKKTNAARNNGPKTPAVSIVVQVVEYHVENPKAPNLDKDYLDAVLLADCPELGKAKGDPVQIKMRPSNFENRRDIASLIQKKGQTKKVLPGGVVEFQKCWLDRQSGMVSSGWLKALVHDKDAKVEHAFAGILGTVYGAKKFDNGDMRQEGVLIDTTNATKFSGKAEFEQYASEMLEPVGPGYPGFVIRVIDTTADLTKTGEEAEKGRYAMMVVRRLEKVGESFEFEPIEKTLDRMANDPKDKMQMGAAFLEDMQSPDPASVWELIPVTKIRIGAASLPNYGDGKNEKVKDYSLGFSVPNGTNKDGTPRTRSMYTTMNAAIRKNEETEAWSLIYANPTHFRDDAHYFTLSDIPTANLPENHLEQVMTAAKARGGDEKAPASKGGEGYDETDHEEEAKAGARP